MQRILIGALSCEAYPERRERCLKTWAAEIDRHPELDIVFLIGGESGPSRREGQALYLPCKDDYPSLPQKVRLFFRWALDHHDCDYIFKCDDDTYIDIERFLVFDTQDKDYIGAEWKPGVNYASGGAGYFVNRKAALIAAQGLEAHPTGAEDLLVGKYLRQSGIPFTIDHRFVPFGNEEKRPKPGNDLITTHACAKPWEVHRLEILGRPPHDYSLEISTEWPLISCVMPTYGRPDYVPEAVACFLEQDYPHKELIVLNDCPGQTYVGNLPGVRIVNLDERYATLGDKRNAAIEMANGELIAVWDDDDLSLPWRLSFSWREMQRHDTPFYRPAEFLAYWGEVQLHDNQSVPGWVSHGMVCFTKQLWADVGGYPSAGGGEDAQFFQVIHRKLGEDFLKYSIAHADRFYILRGKSNYKHLSIHGGEKPLDCSPGTFSIQPQRIKDALLQSAWEQVKQSHGIHAPSSAAAPGSAEAGPVLSVCMAVKNRSRIVHEHRLLDLLPRTVRSLSDSAREIGPLELVIADFSSTDWPLREWLTSGGNLTVSIVDVEGDFSRGRGLNIAAKHAKSDRLFLTDADVLVAPEAIRQGLSALDQGVTRFPIFRHLDIHGREQRWEDFTKGLAFVTRQQLLTCGGVPEFKSWGGEDDIVFDAIKSAWPVERARDDGLLHQWHPESVRHENYVNPRKSDYQAFRSGMLEKTECLELVATFEVEHSEWVGSVRQINLYSNGYLERPGLGCGSYEFIPRVRLTLNWDNWPPEELLWDEKEERYQHPSKSFTARITEAPCDLSIQENGWNPNLATPCHNENGIVKAAIIGLFNSGSSLVAQIVDALGFNLGPPFWHAHFESQSLRSHLANWWKEPQLVEQVSQAERIPVLKQWLELHSSQKELVCAKHPLLCLSAIDLPLAWGDDVKYIRAYRELDESIAKLDARGWFKSIEEPHPAERIQTTLWRASKAFFASQDHLQCDYNDLLANPRREVERLVDYLGISPTEDQIANATELVRQPKQDRTLTAT